LGRSGVIEILRRVAALALLVFAVVAYFGSLGTLPAAAAAIAGILIYVGLKRPQVPRDAFRHEPMPSVYMPDLLGFVIGVPLFSLSFVVVASDPLLSGVWPIYVLFWVPASFSIVIFIIAARYATSWVRVSADGLEVTRFGKTTELPFADIAAARLGLRRLPKWVSIALTVFGGIRGAGVALLHGHRATHTLWLERRDGSSVPIAADALPGIEPVLSALDRAGITLPDELTERARRRIRRRSRGSETAHV